MFYLINVLDTASGTATAAEMAAIDGFNAGLERDGHWVFAGGLTPPDEAVRIGDEVTSPAPAPAGPYVSGMWIIDAPDDDTAARLARQAGRACGRAVELRRFL